ncbi:MAG: hypothetical protein WA324_01645 [Bryobacteraceae bacterium]
MTVRNSAGKETEIPGVDLAAQYACAAGALLLTTEDTPYEEALHCVLLNGNVDMLDDVELSNRMTPGTLSAVRIEEEDALVFSFFGGDLWRLTVFKEPVRKLLTRTGVHYPHSSLFGKHYLDLRRVK